MGAISPSERVLINLFCLYQATVQYAPVFANLVVLYYCTICLPCIRTCSVHFLQHLDDFIYLVCLLLQQNLFVLFHCFFKNRLPISRLSLIPWMPRSAHSRPPCDVANFDAKVSIFNETDELCPEKWELWICKWWHKAAGA